ncbi:TIGR02234 family membrane protein [Microbispora sp. NBC_01189]|uniref:TIGR02234 family membrane protein n=1 Tax=Microbispora sp. NBC_01189 TaxID=2903583 RepID=UPI002E153564|nr:TIGR02234 family membrane protein [Microbispora sp. NBC_01189]
MTTPTPASAPDHAAAPGRAGRTAGRSLLVWLAACAAGGGLALLAAGRRWVTLGAAGGPGGAGQDGLTGGDLVAWLPPAALAALAAAVAVLAARGIGRRAIGGVVALLGAAVAAGAWDGTRDATVAAAARAHATTATISGAAVPVESRAWVWPLLAAAGGLVLLGSGVVAAVRGGRWPGMSGRYERDAGHARAEPGRAPARDADRAIWDALDVGEDPTDDRTDDPTDDRGR